MDVPDEKRRSVEPYLKFLRRLDEDVPLDTRLFHVLYEFTGDDLARLSDALADAGVVAGLSVPAVHIDTRDGIADAVERFLADGHELVVHGYRHTSFLDASYDTAHEELSRSLDIVASVTDGPPTGFHVPYLSASDGTLRAAADLDFEWVVGRRVDGESSAGRTGAASDLTLLQPVHPYDLQLLERGLTPTAAFRRLEEKTDESSLLLCHPNVHLYHEATGAFDDWLRERSFSAPGDLARSRNGGPGLLLDCFPPFRVA